MKKTKPEKKQSKQVKKGEEAVNPRDGELRTTRAVAKYVRISPQRVRLVLNTIRYKPAYKALDILQILNKKAAVLTTKVLNSAIANAKDRGFDQSRLYISDIRADGGPTLKRFQPRSMGRADRILKRTTHLSIVLTEGPTSWKLPADLETKIEEASLPGKKKSSKASAKSAGNKNKKTAKANA